ncbi:MAG: hypothetical protein DDT25_00967 [Chloroflexi bacterium]|nr:hypothetical protein [Chloroflexota bacterium]
MTLNYTDEAINSAMQREWEKAARINESIIKLSPNDISAHNRLGKALTELGQYTEARKAYGRVLELDPNNSIARRNLQRLSYSKDGQGPPKDACEIEPGFFIEEAGKARMVNIHRNGPSETLAKLSAGDHVDLQVRGQALVAVNDSGEYLGEIEPRIGLRLIELMKRGNEYQMAIISLRDDRIKVMIKETFQHPAQIGLPSFFLPRPAEDLKPYLKNTMVKYDLDDEFLEETEGPGHWESEMEPLWQDDIPLEEEVPALVTSPPSPTASPRR